MKKLIVAISFLLFPFMLMASVNKAEFIKKFSKAQKIQKANLSGYMQIEMFMMGLPMKIWGNFWIKEKLYKMDMLTQIPNSPKSIKSLLIFDGKTIWRIGNKMIMKIDVNKLPKQSREEQIQNSPFLGTDKFAENMDKYYKEAKIIDKTKNGKEYYVVTIQGKFIKEITPSNVTNFQKIVLWINKKDMMTRKIEVYGKNKEPGVSIKFKNLSTKSIPESMFIYTPPPNAKVVDMTSIVGSMYGKQSSLQP
ncbi:MAG: hypothetical protein M1135_03655 [Candidatus Omnitrophica bacterium]|nr:hypothetical protein [Candidatus Omnitrophota bacterium]